MTERATKLAWYEKNREDILRKKSEYRQNNKEEMRRRDAEY